METWSNGFYATTPEDRKLVDIDWRPILEIDKDITVKSIDVDAYADYTGQPIWRRATVASSPHFGWEGQKQFLVDCASKQGMSGAPAFFYNLKGSIQLGGTQLMMNSPITVFHGIYVGRIGGTSEFEAQIGRVWKRKVIDEIIDNEQVDYLHDELLLCEKDIMKVIEENWPSDKNKYAEDMLKEDSMLSKIYRKKSQIW
jgi:hypothetical protein